MNNFQNKMYKFMYGRYGIDDLYKFNIVIYIILFIINIFVNSIIVSIIELIIFIIIIYRVFSKNINKRKKENNLYLKIIKKILKPFKCIEMNIKDKNHIYKKCHYCNTIMKLPLPSKIGIKYSSCPECKKKNKFLVLRKLKVEVIRKK